jgi:hypothetical protein
MLCYTILYYTILYYTILYWLHYTIRHYIMLYYTILYCTVLYYTIRCYTNTILYNTVPYCTILILYYTILHCTILHYTMLYCTILYYTKAYLPLSSEYCCCLANNHQYSCITQSVLNLIGCRSTREASSCSESRNSPHLVEPESWLLFTRTHEMNPILILPFYFSEVRPSSHVWLSHRNFFPFRFS